MDPTISVPGTGMTVGDLQAVGYSDTDIQAMFSAGDIPTTGGGGVAYGPSQTASAPVVSSSSSSWASGIASMGTALTNVIRAVDPPKAGTTLYNPATGLPYGINPATGLPVASATSQSLIVLVVFGLLIWAAFKAM